VNRPKLQEELNTMKEKKMSYGDLDDQDIEKIKDLEDILMHIDLAVKIINKRDRDRQEQIDKIDSQMPKNENI
jgi:hypothetical protein